MTAKKQKRPPVKPAKKRAAAKKRTAVKANSAAAASRTAVRKTAKAETKAAAPEAVPAAEPVAVTPATAVMNAKLADIARANMNAGLELACGLASAKSPMEAMRLGLAYWYDHVGVFQAQAQELRQLSADLVTMANEPIRESMRRG